MAGKNMEISNGRLGAALTIQAQPEALADQITEIQPDGTLVIDLACGSEQTEMNDRLIRYLAGILKVPVASVEIVAGERGSKKLVSILDVSSAYVNQEILQEYR